MSDKVFTDQNFDTHVMAQELPVLVDFWAVWCKPCVIQGPIVEEIAKDMEGKAVVGKFNVDENPQIAQKFGIMSIPTIMIFHKGAVVKQFVGVQSKENLMNGLQQVLAQ
jgi:thioredoxin 1